MKHRRILLSISILCLGFAVGFFYPRETIPMAREIRDNSGEYEFINPLIAVSLGPKDLFPQYKPLEQSLSAYIGSAVGAKKADDISVYFKNLNDGTWTGVNEAVPYAPSSMLKVVVMLAYLDHAEDDPSILQKRYYFKHTSDDGEYFKPTHVLSTGERSVQGLLESMIVDSDNDALAILLDNDKDRIALVNKVLRLPNPASDDATTDFMSARQYSIVFRTLYNATYLSRSVSEQALKLLAQTTFTEGLVAGVPKGTVVAHKFGERTAIENNIPASRELHDCGIVYAPGKPYLICVMTKGQDFKELSGVIADISKLVYDSVKGTK